MKMSFKKSTLIVVALVLCTFSSASSLFAALSVSITPSSDQIVLKGESVSFSCSPSGGCTPYTYDWSFQNATPGSSTSQSSVATFGASAEGNVNNIMITVTDSSGATASAGMAVTVPKVTTQTVATTPSDRLRKKLGVGESVVLTVTPSSIGSVSWSLTGAGYEAPDSGITTTYYAVSPSNSKVKATFDGGKNIETAFTVVAPSGVLLERNVSVSSSTNPLGLQYTADIYLTPSDVNFSELETTEGVCFASTAGYFSYQLGMSHIPNPTLVPYGDVVEGKGTKSLGIDTISGGTIGPPYSNGTFQWDIPWNYHFLSLITQFKIVPHLKELVMNSGKATLKISKAGSSGSVTEP